MINHRIARLIFAFTVGVLLAILAYRSVTDPEPARQRAQEEQAVQAARAILRDKLAQGASLQLVDPLAPDRVVGKTYIYPVAAGWQVSGHYRRNDLGGWHPFLLTMTGGLELQSLSVQDDDPALVAEARADSRLTVKP